MNETKFTPGPWRLAEALPAFIGDGKYPSQPVSCFEISGKLDVCWVALVQEHKNCIATSGDANARLIAAAPDLYVALSKAVHELNAIRARDGKPWTGVPVPMPTDVCEDYFSTVVDEGFAALAKARGDQESQKEHA